MELFGLGDARGQSWWLLSLCLAKYLDVNVFSTGVSGNNARNGT